MKKTLFLSILSATMLTAAPQNVDELFELSLDDLMNVQVSEVTRKNEAPFKATSAVYVVTSEQIRRSGANNIPEALRMVPGVHVGRISGSQYSISIRAVNNALSDDVLVMVDGREVFNRFSNGTYWDSINYPLEDIDRIEVIRGPGGSLWGSNASNGIINIVTKKATTTQDTLFSTRVGSGQDRINVSARSGFGNDESYTRLYVTGKNIQRSELASTHQQTTDGLNFTQVGFRHDNSNNLTLQGDAYSGISEFTSGPVDLHGANILLRFEPQKNTKLQLYYDYTSRENSSKKNQYHNIDIDYQQTIDINDNNQLIYGFGGRYTKNDFSYTFSGVPILAVQPLNREDMLGRFFIQNDMSINEFVISQGIKYEYNDYIYAQWQPSIKLGWYPNESLSVWASISRTVATPSRIDSDAYLDFGSGSTFPIGNSLLGEPLEPSVQNVYELGSRFHPLSSIYLDLATFFNDYEVVSATSIDKIYGAELNMIYEPVQNFLSEISYTYHEGFRKNNDALNDLHKHLITAHINYKPLELLETDLYYYYYSKVTNIEEVNRLDFNIGYTWSPSVYIALLGQNLLEATHIEANEDPIIQKNTLIERSVLLQATLTF